MCLKLTDRAAEAETVYRQSIDLYQKVFASPLSASHRAADSSPFRMATGVEFDDRSLTFQLADTYGGLIEVVLRDGKRVKEAEQLYGEALRLGLEDPVLPNKMAWALAISPTPTADTRRRAVELAEKAVQAAPTNGGYQNTLGVAQYRAGNWHEAQTALRKSMELGNGGNSFDWFFLAMAHWQLGAKDEARKWYDNAVEWMDKNAKDISELRRFRNEAEDLLEIKKK